MVSLPTLPPALRKRVLRLLDMKTILQLRASSSQYMDMVVDELREEMEAAAAPYVPRPRALLDFLPSMDAYIGGSALIPFFVRDVHYTANALEVFVPFLHVRELCNHLEREQHAREEDDFGSDDDFDNYLPPRASRGVTQYRTPIGIVKVITGRFVDPLAPIACAWSSLHVCFANGRYFGHGYPALTLAHRGLVGDGVGEESEVCARTQRCLDRGFDMRMSAGAWPEFAGKLPCPAGDYVCAAQPRCFTDAGAMSCRMRPLETDTIHTTVMWRLDYRPCGGRCLSREASYGILDAFQRFDAL